MEPRKRVYIYQPPIRERCRTNELCMYVDIECKIVEFICAGKVKRLSRHVAKFDQDEGEIEGGKRTASSRSAHENKVNMLVKHDNGYFAR